jgi:hypothetical protein
LNIKIYLKYTIFIFYGLVIGLGCLGVVREFQWALAGEVDNPILGYTIGLGCVASGIIGIRAYTPEFKYNLVLLAGLSLLFVGLILISVELDALMFGEPEEAIYGYVAGVVFLGLGIKMIWGKLNSLCK